MFMFEFRLPSLWNLEKCWGYFVNMHYNIYIYIIYMCNFCKLFFRVCMVMAGLLLFWRLCVCVCVCVCVCAFFVPVEWTFYCFSDYVRQIVFLFSDFDGEWCGLSELGSLRCKWALICATINKCVFVCFVHCFSCTTRLICQTLKMSNMLTLVCKRKYVLIINVLCF